MLEILDRLAALKQEELRRIEDIHHSLRTSDPRLLEWQQQWKTVLEQTRRAVQMWREYWKLNPLLDETDPNFAEFLEDIDEQSEELNDQLEQLEKSTDQPASTSPSTDTNAKNGTDPTATGTNNVPDTAASTDPEDESAAPDKRNQGPSENETIRNEIIMTGDGMWSAPPAQEGISSVPIGGHTLPPLPYPYNALEPHIDEETMRLHHDKHHQSYVDGLNKAEKKMAEARKKKDFELIKHWEREAAFNGAGHYLHTIFWEEMSPEGGGKPSGALLHQLEQDFGGFELFKKHFSAAAEKVEGGGWAILVWSPRSHRLEILQAEKHQNLTQWDVVPLLALDVWEHAYYLKYKNERAKYIEAWWNVINWPYVENRFQQASQLAWTPPY